MASKRAAAEKAPKAKYARAPQQHCIACRGVVEEHGYSCFTCKRRVCEECIVPCLGEDFGTVGCELDVFWCPVHAQRDASHCHCSPDPNEEKCGLVHDIHSVSCPAHARTCASCYVEYCSLHAVEWLRCDKCDALCCEECTIQCECGADKCHATTCCKCMGLLSGDNAGKDWRSAECK